MKIYFYETVSQSQHYTSKLLKHLIRRQPNLSVVDEPYFSDCIFVSVCDITELYLIREARKFNKPIVSGGALSQFPVMRIWSDYVCVGEAYDFIEKLNNVKNIKDIEEFSEISTRTKEGTLNENIHYELNPIIYLGTAAAYYYCGKGCPQKCKYCLMGNSRKWQYAEEERFIKAIRTIKTGKLYPMLSHFPYKNIPKDLHAKLGILDVRVTDTANIKNKNIRTGIEFLSEEKRKLYGKPILDKKITEFIKRTQYHNQNAVLYFIAGLESDSEADYFIDNVLPESNKTSPRLITIFTYLDPQITTPMADFDIRKKLTFNGETFFKKAIRKNRGIRVHTIKYKAFSSWRTIMQRCKNLDELEFCFDLRKEKNNDRLIETIEKNYPYLLGTEGTGQKARKL